MGRLYGIGFTTLQHLSLKVIIPLKPCLYLRGSTNIATEGLWCHVCMWEPPRVTPYLDSIVAGSGAPVECRYLPKLLPCLKQSPHNYSCFGIHHRISLRRATASSNSEAVRAPDVLKLGWGSSESNTDHVSKFTCMCYGSQLTTIKTLVSVWTLKKVIDCSSRKRMGQLVLTPSHIQKRFNKITAPNWTPTSKVRRVYDADPLVL